MKNKDYYYLLKMSSRQYRDIICKYLVNMIPARRCLAVPHAGLFTSVYVDVNEQSKRQRSGQRAGMDLTLFTTAVHCCQPADKREIQFTSVTVAFVPPLSNTQYSSHVTFIVTSTSFHWPHTHTHTHTQLLSQYDQSTPVLTWSNFFMLPHLPPLLTALHLNPLIFHGTTQRVFASHTYLEINGFFVTSCTYVYTHATQTPSQ